VQQPRGAEGNFLLSTVHSAKGLEYDTVYLMDAVDGILPKEGEDTDLEEERRLFYVAITRAKEELHVFTLPKSSFAQVLFPKEEKKAVRPLPRSVSARRAAVPAISPEVFREGQAVAHKIFGPGKVIGRKGDVLTVELEDGTQKRLLISAALRSGVLNIR